MASMPLDDSILLTLKMITMKNKTLKLIPAALPLLFHLPPAVRRRLTGQAAILTFDGLLSYLPLF